MFCESPTSGDIIIVCRCTHYTLHSTLWCAGGVRCAGGRSRLWSGSEGAPALADTSGGDAAGGGGGAWAHIPTLY